MSIFVEHFVDFAHTVPGAMVLSNLPMVIVACIGESVAERAWDRRGESVGRVVWRYVGWATAGAWLASFGLLVG